MSMPDKAPKLGGAKPQPLTRQPGAIRVEPQGAAAAVPATPPSGHDPALGPESDPIAELAAKDAAARPRRLGLILTLLFLQSAINHGLKRHFRCKAFVFSFHRNVG